MKTNIPAGATRSLKLDRWRRFLLWNWSFWISIFKLRQRFTSDTEQDDYIPTNPSTTQQQRLEEEKTMIETNLFIAGSYPDSYNWLPWEYQVAAAVGGIWVLGATDENLDCFVDALKGLGKFVQRETKKFKGGNSSQLFKRIPIPFSKRRWEGHAYVGFWVAYPKNMAQKSLVTCYDSLIHPNGFPKPEFLTQNLFTVCVKLKKF